jgi:hypothetical protein
VCTDQGQDSIDLASIGKQAVKLSLDVDLLCSSSKIKVLVFCFTADSVQYYTYLTYCQLLHQPDAADSSKVLHCTLVVMRHILLFVLSR